MSEVPLGVVKALTRYPVKSMAGEALAACALDAGGLAGDRRFAVIDADGDKVASAKQPRRWAGLLGLTAGYDGEPSATSLRVSLPDGRRLAWNDPDLAAAIGALSGRAVRLAEAPIHGAHIERLATEYDQDPGSEGDIPIGVLGPPGALYDAAPVHLIATSSLDALDADARRFRANILVDGAGPPYIENEWIGRILRIGTAVLRVVTATPRCVIPALSHGDLPGDPPLLKRINLANRVNVPLVGPSPCIGVYAIVVTPGSISVGAELTTAFDPS